MHRQKWDPWAGPNLQGYPANLSSTPTTIVLQRSCNYSVFTPAVVGTAFPTIKKTITLSGGPGTILGRSQFAILSFRILDVAAGGNLTVSGVTITNGRTAGNISTTLLNQNTTTGVGGGGILNSGLLTVFQSNILSNTAAVNGGGVNRRPERSPPGRARRTSLRAAA